MARRRCSAISRFRANAPKPRSFASKGLKLNCRAPRLCSARSTSFARPLDMLTRFARRSLTLAGGAIESGPSRLHDTFDRALTFAFAGPAFAAIDQEMMLEIA